MVVAGGHGNSAKQRKAFELRTDAVVDQSVRPGRTRRS